MRAIRIVLVCCLSLGLLSCDAFRRGLNGNRRGSLNYLKSEFEQVQPLTHSVKGHQWSTEEGRQGHVGAPYTTTQSEDAITSHYHSELSKRGWRFLKNEKVIYAGRDRGGQHIFFCKDIYTADLQLAGDQEQEFGWTYSFSLSWGTYDECS